LHDFQQGVWLYVPDSLLTPEDLQKGVRVNEVGRSDREKSTKAAVQASPYMATQHQADIL